MRSGFRSLLSSIIVIVMFLTTLLPAMAQEPNITSTPIVIEDTSISKSLKYSEYIKSYSNWDAKPQDLDLIGNKYAKASDTIKVEDNYRSTSKSCVIISDNSFAEWNVTMPKNGLYQIVVTYMPCDDSNGDIEQSILIDGQLPFSEIGTISYKRSYEQSKVISSDVSGNDIKPSITEVFSWSELAVQDSSGYISEPYLLGLSQGTHTIRLSGSRGSIAINKITLRQKSTVLSYNEYLSSNKSLGHSSTTASDITIVEAEHISYKSDVSILPVVDRSSPATKPQSVSASKLNTVGGNSWKRIGERITWSIKVKKSGMYILAPRFRQNMLEGFFTSRKLLLDGIVPFKEAQNLRFNFSSQWQLEPLGGKENPYLFYLSKGEEHTFSMEVVMGDVAEVIGSVQQSLTTLNTIYRKIIMISGTSPDEYRDYNFKSLIPNEIKDFKIQRDLLQSVVNTIDANDSADGSYTTTLKKIIFQLDRMYEKPEALAKYLEQFKSNIGALGTWLLTANEQPLQIDRFYIAPVSTTLPKPEYSTLRRIGYGIESFIYSFFNDYGSIGQSSLSSYDNTVKVWLQTGRDQAEILRQLVDTSFTHQFKTTVKLELVAPGTLLQSVLAGLGPDVVLNNAASEPINYAVRNANIDLTQFPDFKEVSSRFHPSAVEPYQYKGKVYALPETFTFPMFFYRKDIFNELGLKAPKTWDELMDLIPELQRKNLTMAFPKDLNGYALILYQNGGNLYINEGEKVDLKSNVALNSFLQFTEMFTLYDLPISYDFSNRFRSGEMPCGITDYSVYNQLTVFAPEIKGLWDFVPVPGKLGADGKPNNITVGTGMGDMIMSSTKNKNSSWEFLKWWLSADIQSTYAKDMESILGPAAKHPTANMEALTKMTWSSKEYSNLLSQIKTVKAVPEVPGGYYLSRVVTFALNRVYNQSGTQNMAENPIDVITEYVDEMNDELTRKRQEFSIR